MPQARIPIIDYLATATRRKILFGLLYLSEGAPIGFIWLGIPTRLRAADLPVDKITWLMALLILPWTLKFLWAPLVDLLRGSGWGFKQWILASQTCMALTLLPLVWLDFNTQFTIVSGWLLLHAICAATQDVSIDALCVQQSQPIERAALNGWMQCGVLVGRAAMGGGSLVLEHWIGFPAVVLVLIAIVMSSSILLLFAKERHLESAAMPQNPVPEANRETILHRCRSMVTELYAAVRTRTVWIGFLFALIAPAAFKSLEAVVGPFLIDRGYTELQIGQFTSTAMILGMIAGSLLAGRIAGLFQGSRFVAIALVLNVTTIGLLGAADALLNSRPGSHLFILLTFVSVAIGWFTVALYQWLMNLTSPRLAATQFTAFMAATNACEAWSTASFGSIQSARGYPFAILVMCAISLSALLLLIAMRSEDHKHASMDSAILER